VAVAAPTVADLTVEEFRHLVRDVVAETLADLLTDPDQGLELLEDVKVDLRRSLAASQAGDETVAAETVAARLGLTW
jgi:hypothetical protein